MKLENPQVTTVLAVHSVSHIDRDCNHSTRISMYEFKCYFVNSSSCTQEQTAQRDSAPPESPLTLCPRQTLTLASSKCTCFYILFYSYTYAYNCTGLPQEDRPEDYYSYVLKLPENVVATFDTPVIFPD